MKIIITERQRKLISEDEDREFLVKKKFAKKYLNKKFGDLTPVADEIHANNIFYVNNDRKIYFEYSERSGVSFIDYNTIWFFLSQHMGFNIEQAQQVTKEWLEEHYELWVTGTMPKLLSNLTI